MYRYYEPMLYMLIGLAVVGGVGALLYWKWYWRAEEARPGGEYTRIAFPREYGAGRGWRAPRGVRRPSRIMRKP